MKHDAHMRKLKGAALMFCICAAVFALILLRYDASNVLPDVKSYAASPMVLARDGELLHAYLSRDDEWCMPISLDRMGRWTALAAVCIEDKRFYEHNGVDLIAVLRSTVYNLKARRIVTGASTISSQLIRTALPRPRTFGTKMSEFWMAMKLENKLDKDEILELYLNRVPFGGNIRGVEAASRAYFSKSAEGLSLAESVALLSLLPAPSRLRPDRYPERAQAARDANLAKMLSSGLITEEQYRTAKLEAMTAKRYSISPGSHFIAAHATKNSLQTINRTTISKKMQEELAAKIKLGLARYPLGVTAASIIIDNRTREVLAYVGNGRFGQKTEASQVDCGKAPRSPGSVLKPFIFAAAIEKGLLTPETMLADSPIAFKGSSPRNFDRSYRGPVSARSALASSLNAPSVRVLRHVGYDNAVNKLRALGFEYIDKPGSYYADALALGGCETTLIQLAAAYATLAGEGRYSPLKWQTLDSSTERSVLSRASCYVTLDMLRDTDRILPIYREIFNEAESMISFKTGTSYGLRDAWAAGVSKNYTVIVWMGNPKGEGATDLIGLNAAVPLLLNIFRDIYKAEEFRKPEEVYTREVCALSGLSPSKYCPSLIRDLAIRDISSASICAMHRIVDGKTDIIWPRELAYWINRTTPALKDEIKIIKPRSGSRIILGAGKNTETLNFLAEGKAPRHWFLDGKYVGIDENPVGIFVEVAKGKHKAVVLSGGAEDSIEFELVESHSGNDNINIGNEILK